MSSARHTGASTKSKELATTQGGADGAATRRKGKPARAGLHSSDPVQVIMVGCGAAAQQLYRPALRALERSAELAVRVVVDPLESSRKQFLDGFPRAESHPSLDSVRLPPDAVAILASAPRFHGAQAAAAFKRGWHVVCHSPLATNSREAAMMTAAAQRHERLLGVILHRRFFPALQYLRTLCRDHLLGPPISFSIREGGPGAWPPPPAAFPAKFEPPDGVLTEMGVHTLDFLVWCLGEASLLNYSDDAMGGVEANAFLELSFPDGVRGTVHLSHDWPTAESYVFVFERGLVRWKVDQASRLTFQLASAPAALEGILLEPIAATDPNAPANPLSSNERSFLAQLQDVIASVAGRKALLVPATAALPSLALIEECYARRTLAEQPWLTHNEAVNARALSLPAELPRP
jgi:predicted dehydrogenase